MATSLILRSLHRLERRSASSSAYRIIVRKIKKEMKQESEWLEAQKIVISLDLLGAAKRHLRFLSKVDGNCLLYDGPVLQRAIYRYNACWLPLLSKHTKSPVCEGLLVVPIDCEWVWHCHRLNPVRYKSDCEELYGSVLDNSGIVSSITGISSAQTEEIWNQTYADETYHFDLKNEFIGNADEKLLAIEKCTEYDLVSAVKRQSTFFYQVSEDHMKDDIFLKEAIARYKGFLHLIKRNRENSVKRFCVPTYDIDLIWHTHQLHPVAYCKDLAAAIGKVLNHDDTDSDRSKGKKLDIGFSETTKQWEDTFGRRYWKEGAMYRGKNVVSCGVGCGSGGCGGACGGMVNSGGCGAGRGDMVQSGRDGGDNGLFVDMAMCGGDCGGGCGGGCGG